MTEKGRSMVEMLGVLAIVGILSAGAMAGYSKAMQMHKMNRFTDDFNYFLGQAINFSNEAVTYTVGENNMLSSVADRLGLLNGALTLNDDKIYDAFQNHFLFYYVPSDADYRIDDMDYRIRYELQKNEQSNRICEQLIKIGQAYSQNLSIMMVRNTDSDSNITDNRIHGDSSCTSGRTCLSEIGLKEMNALCSICQIDDCYVYFMWK